MVARIGYRSIVAALLLGLAAALLLALLPRLHERVVVRAGDVGALIAEGETTTIRSFYGFNQVETSGATSFRWTDGLGNFVVRSGERLGAPLIMRLRLCGCRSDEDAISSLLIRVNGVTLTDAAPRAARGGWRRYALLVNPTTTEYSPDLLIELVSDTINNPQFGFPMGVALDSVELAPALPQRSYNPFSALVLGLAIGALALVSRTNDPSAPLRAGERRTTKDQSPLSTIVDRQSSVVALAAFGLVAAQGLLYRPQPLSVEIFAIGLLLAVGLALLARAAPIVSAGLALLLCALVVAPQLLGSWMLDDSFISFRYARNALQGRGLVFNPGERVEGYTNFLWTALFVPIQGAGLNPALASQALTLLLALATAALVWLGARRLGGPIAATAAVALLATSTPFVLYAARGSGMETALFTLLVLAAVLVYATRWNQEPRQANSSVVDDRSSVVGMLLAFAAMTRPEGVLVAGVCGLHMLAQFWHNKQISWQQVFGLAIGFLGIFGPYYLWRFTYYGYPLPNTFYAKVGSTSAQALRGLVYTAEFAWSQAPLLVITLCSLLPEPRTKNQEPPRGYPTENRGRETSRQADKESGDGHFSMLDAQYSMLNFLWLLVGIYTLYIIAVGGDHFPLYRFFVPLLPPLALLAALGLKRIASVIALPASRPAVALLMLAVIGWQAPQLYASRTFNGAGQVWSENSVVEKNREIGMWLRAHTPTDTLIATGIAGAMPFYAERPALDTLGLNDLHIAHLQVSSIGQGVAGAEKTDDDYILSRDPDYIPYSSAGTLLENPRFLQLYDRGIVHGPEGRWLRLYKRHDLAPPEGWAPIEDQ
jgi:arabinofuranosyltransferase